MTLDNEITNRIWIHGIVCSDACGNEGEDALNITFEIPGVKKEDINLKIIPDGIRLIAKRDKTTEYVSEYAFICPADVDKVKAKYSDGILDVEIPLACKDPFSDGKQIVLK